MPLNWTRFSTGVMSELMLGMYADVLSGWMCVMDEGICAGGQRLASTLYMRRRRCSNAMRSS